MNVLVVNVGSSSVKLDIVAHDDAALRSHTSAGPVTAEDVEQFAAGGPEWAAIGHRIVHGGERYTSARVIDTAMLAELDELCDLAPLHNPPAVAVVRALIERGDPRPNVACFDTAFHSTLPVAARTYAIPVAWREQLGVRRFGFHGLSHQWAASRAAELLGGPDPDRRVVTCHLGAGASLAAVKGGCSVDTTMGFTPVEGLVMSRRSGDVDPGALAWLTARHRIAPSEIEDALNHASGLVALAGTDDMHAVLEAEAREDADAALAVDVYTHRLVKGIAAMAAAMGGIDGLVFTGGVGARSPRVRALACGRLGFLGVELAADRNEHANGDAEIGADGAAVRTFVVVAREEIEIARQVRAALAPPRSETEDTKGDEHREQSHHDGSHPPFGVIGRRGLAIVVVRQLARTDLEQLACLFEIVLGDQHVDRADRVHAVGRTPAQLPDDSFRTQPSHEDLRLERRPRRGQRHHVQAVQGPQASSATAIASAGGLALPHPARRAGLARAG